MMPTPVRLKSSRRARGAPRVKRSARGVVDGIVATVSKRRSVPDTEGEETGAPVRRAVTSRPSHAGAAAQNVDRRIAQRALELIQQDAELDDDKFTPPAAIGLCVESPRTSREPRAAR